MLSGGTLDFLQVLRSEWERTFRINLTTPMLLMQAFARHAVRRGGGGRIVTVTSSSAFRADQAGYGAPSRAVSALLDRNLATGRT